MSNVLTVIHDVGNDVVIIDGVPYAGDLFRQMSLASPGSWLRIEDRRNQCIDVFNANDETCALFDRVTKRGLYAENSARTVRKTASKE